MSEDLQIINKEWSSEVASLSLQGELNESNVLLVEQQFQALLDGGFTSVVVDLQYLTQLSNIGGGALLSCMRGVQDAGGRVTVVRPARAAQETLERLRVNNLLEIVESAEEARQLYGLGRKGGRK